MNSVLIGGRQWTNSGRAHLEDAMFKKYVVLYRGMIYEPCYIHRMA